MRERRLTVLKPIKLLLPRAGVQVIASNEHSVDARDMADVVEWVRVEEDGIGTASSIQTKDGLRQNGSLLPRSRRDARALPWG
jgi:hypothetical protein